MEITPVLERHFTRIEVRYVNNVRMEIVWTPDNADPERAGLNQELVSREYIDEDGTKKTLTINQAINRRIKEAGITSIRENQSKAIEIILSGSPETMNAMKEEEIAKWTDESMKWVKKQFGEENVVAAVLHRDEKTPHIHVILVPIVQGESRRSASRKDKLKKAGKTSKQYNIDVSKNRLCANEVYTKPRLYGYHTGYAETVGKQFGLSRGIKAEIGSVKRHQSSEEYNRELARQAAEQQKMIAEFQADYTSAEEKKKQAEKEKKEAEDKKILAEQQAAEKEAKVKELEEKHTSLSREISQKETTITELDATIDEKDHEVSESFSLKEALDTYNEQLTTENKELQATITQNKTKISEQQTTIDTNLVKISTQEDDLTYYEQQLDNYKDIEIAIEKRKNELKALSSFGLMKLIKQIPEMIRSEIQSRVSKYWKGTVEGYEKVQYNVAEEEEPKDFVKINMRNGNHDYFIEVQEDTGYVYLDGSSKRYKYPDTGNKMTMPELAAYFRQELLPETKEFVKSLYEKVEPKPAEAVEQGDRVVWECNLGINNCRIVEKPDGICNLEREEWEKSKVDQNGRYTEKVWKKQKGFKSFKELKRDKDFAYLELTHSDGKKEYVNQYGNGLSPKQKKSLGIPTSGMTLG